MVALEVWYRHAADGEASPLVVETATQLDELVDRILDETVSNRVPVMVQVAVAGDWKRGVMEVGLGHDQGFIVFQTADGGSTKGAGSPEDFVEYVYMGSLSEVPADVEVPIQMVRRGLREFLETGTRPSVVQ
ncbi:Imm1 family immunity protein [Kutzneria sp. NPDC051319]|uniref:Imm1 family immunity protein n=1 Tax=Kutzneria sp. NPDC051319 TaxID=3155047 RepID=UPI00341AD0E7